MTLHFSVTADNVVHLKACKYATDALPYRTAIDTLDGMCANLARADIKDGHSYPCLMSPCTTCIGA